jgi:hypothetical protein
MGSENCRFKLRYCLPRFYWQQGSLRITSELLGLIESGRDYTHGKFPREYDTGNSINLARISTADKRATAAMRRQNAIRHTPALHQFATGIAFH